MKIRSTTAKKPRCQEESREQMLIVRYLNLKYPNLLFTSALGGINAPSIQEAVRRKRLGYRKSWPDLTILSPRGGFHGLLIELKKTGGSCDDPDQIAFLVEADRLGYKAVCCIGYQIAIKTIDAYLKLGR